MIHLSTQFSFINFQLILTVPLSEISMSKIEKISIAHTPDVAANVKEPVAAGEFASSSEVIRAALREFQENREKKALILEQIGKAWDEGISGEFYDADDVFAELDEIIAKDQKGGKAA